jgi:hypothetical protein
MSGARGAPTSFAPWPPTADSRRLRKLANPWTEEEKRVFEVKFVRHPKNFRKIASFLPNKTCDAAAAAAAAVHRDSRCGAG